MNGLVRALSAEIMKTRRTLALAMTVLAPLVIALLQFAMYFDHGDSMLRAAGDDIWVHFAQTMLVYWALLMLPLFITLETALLSGADHAQRHWTLLYTLQVPRWAYYAAKVLVNAALIALSTLVLLVMMRVVGALLQVIRPEYGLDAPVPWGIVFKYAGLVYLASWLMISIHVWISMRWKSFSVALGVGIAATVAAIFILNREDSAMWYPWTMPGLVAAKMDGSLQEQMATMLGAAGGLVVSLLGGWHIGQRDVL